MTGPPSLQPPKLAAVHIVAPDDDNHNHHTTKAEEADTPLLLKRTSTFRAPQSHVAYKPEDGFITK